MSISTINQMFDRYGKGVMFVLCCLISFAFISFFSPGGGCACEGGGSERTIGTSFGRGVSEAEYMRHMRYISTVADPRSDMFAELAYDFSGITAHDAAKRMGITVTDEEVANYQVAMLTGGELSYAEANKNLDIVLKRNGMNRTQFQEAIKYFLTIRKFYMLGSSAPIVTTSEVAAYADATHQVFNGNIVRFNSWDYRDSATVTDTDISNEYNRRRAAYEAANRTFTEAENRYNTMLQSGTRKVDELQAVATARDNAARALANAEQAGYMRPESYDIMAAVFPCVDTQPEVLLFASKITDSDLVAHFEANKEMFPGPDMSNPDSGAFEHRKADIRRDMVRGEAQRLMTQKANALCNILNAAGIDEKPIDERIDLFSAEAAKMGAGVAGAKGFSRDNNNIVGFGNNWTLTDELAKLPPGTSLTYPSYNQNMGGQVVVALRYGQSRPEFQTLAQAKNTIQWMLSMAQQDSAASVAAEAFSKMANAELDKGKSFKTVAGSRTIEDLKPFAPNQDSFPQDDRFYEAISMETYATSAGKVTKPIKLENQGYVVIYVSKTSFPSSEEIRTDTKFKTGYEGLKQRQSVIELVRWLEDNTVRRFRSSDAE